MRPFFFRERPSYTAYAMGKDVGNLRSEDGRQDRRIDALEAKFAEIDPDLQYARARRLRREKRSSFAHSLTNDARVRVTAIGLGVAVPFIVGWSSHIASLHFHLF